MNRRLHVFAGLTVLGVVGSLLMFGVPGSSQTAADARSHGPGMATALADVHTELLQEPEYEGSRSGCMRCHLREYRSWSDTPHANAIETLPEEERSNPECLECHTTGYGEPSGFQSVEETPELAHVGCEACHGPGSIYKDREIMEDLEASLANGLVVPDEQTCRDCHNEESPTFPGTFDYEEMRERGVHEISR